MTHYIVIIEQKLNQNAETLYEKLSKPHDPTVCRTN